MKRFIALARKGTVTPSGVLFIGMLLISFGLVGCGGKLGKVETSAVDTALADAEAAIAAAVDVEAPTLTSDLFEAAETNLQAAKTARDEKKGNDALRLAYQAVADATLARTNSINITKNSELNASILQKKAEVEELREAMSQQAGKTHRTSIRDSKHSERGKATETDCS